MSFRDIFLFIQFLNFFTFTKYIKTEIFKYMLMLLNTYTEYNTLHLYTQNYPV